MTFGDVIIFNFLPLFALGWAWILYSLVANHRVYAKCRQLVKRMQSIPQSQYSKANQEFNKVNFREHYKACLWLQNPKKLYGPLIQSIWDGPPQVHDSFWWACYDRIYLNLPSSLQDEINRMMVRQKISLPTACHRLSGIDCGEMLFSDEAVEPPKFSMTEGAQEYDEAMRAEEMMHGV